MRRPSAIPAARRRAFGKMLRCARLASGLNLQAAAAAVSQRLDDPEIPSWQWVQKLEKGPPEPLANPVWLGALLESLGLGWYEALNALGIGDSMYPEKCPLHPKADGPLVGRERARGGGFDYRVHCPQCSAPGPAATSRDGAIGAWNQVVLVHRGVLTEHEEAQASELAFPVDWLEVRVVKPSYAAGKVPLEKIERAVRTVAKVPDDYGNPT